MRITNSMMMGNYLSDLSGNLNRLSKYLQQQTTGKSINRISDDPVGVTKSLLARNRLTGTERYQENVKTAQNWLSETEAATASLNESIQQAYERAVSASNGHLTEDNLKAIAEDIAQLKEEILSTGNAMIGDSYLFAGYNTTNRPEIGMPFTVDTKGHLYYNGINMSNEGFSDTISDAFTRMLDSTKEGSSLHSAEKAFGAVASITGNNGKLANLQETVNNLKKAVEAGKTAGDRAADIAGSKDHLGSNMAALLNGRAKKLSELVNGVPADPTPPGTPAIEGADSLTGTAEGLINTARTLAEEEELAYNAWQKAVGTSDEAELKTQYDDAVIKTADAVSKAETAVSTALTETKEIETEAGKLDTLIKGADEAAGALMDAAADFDIALKAYEKLLDEGADPAVIASARAEIILQAGKTKTAATAISGLAGGGMTDLDAKTVPLTDAIALDDLDAIKTAMQAMKTADLSGFDAMTKASRALDKEHGNQIELQVGNAHTMGISATGTELLGRGNNNIYAALDNLHKALKSGDQDTVRTSLDKLQSAQSRVLSHTAEIGAKTQRLDTLTKRYQENVINYTQMRSDAEDVDMAEAIMKFSSAQSVYNAALAAGSKVIQTSLIDFLR